MLLARKDKSFKDVAAVLKGKHAAPLLHRALSLIFAVTLQNCETSWQMMSNDLQERMQVSTRSLSWRL